MFTDFARLRDPELGDWIEREVRFPNSMVDRITPATTDDDRAELRERFGVEDQWPVVCEPFTQWVLEDDFSAGRPPLEDAGVQLVDDVEPYELMKLRLLNASHQALCYFALPGRLPARARGRAGPAVRRVPAAATWTRRRRRRCRRCPGVDLADYKQHADRALRQPRGARHRRPAVRRELGPHPEVAAAGGPRSNLRSGGEIERRAAVVASWARYAEGVDEQGEPIEVVDRLEDG